MKILSISILFLILMTGAGCKKFIDVDLPVNVISTDNVFSSDALAASVVTGWYQTMSNQNSAAYYTAGFLTTMYTSAGLSADELVCTSTSMLVPYSRNNLSAKDAQVYWTSIYPVIYKINAAIEGLEKSAALSSAVKQQLLGEAKFMRAFHYSYLVSFYGDVPLALTTDSRANVELPRAPVAEVYQQIINDLKDAQALLSEQYLQANALTPYAAGFAERVRPTKWAATALLARVYLYKGDYINAAMQASIVINNNSTYRLVPLEFVFQKNNREAIWQLQPVGKGINANTGEGLFFILPPGGPGPNNPVYLRRELLNSFEEKDQRKTKWINYVKVNNTTYYYPAKYKIGAVNTSVKEYPTILRLAELYLIRAEAKAWLNKLQDAAADLNVIRNRAGLPGINTNSQAAILKAVLQERKVELFTEWGHRWFDLIRTGNANTVLGDLKGADWQLTDQLYPIPEVELLKSPYIQNAGY